LTKGAKRHYESRVAGLHAKGMSMKNRGEDRKGNKMTDKSIKKKAFNESLYNSVREILTEARGQAYRAVNFAMVKAYWQIGKLIVEEEQSGKARAEYGKAILEELAIRLTTEYGKGFDARELRKMRQFYLNFAKWDAVRPELTWTHYRLLLRVENAQAREWYMNEAVTENWSSRQLDRQISVLYYERLALSHDKGPVRVEAVDKIEKIEPEQFIRNPYVLEFLNLKEYPALRENCLEQALIDNLQAFLLELGKGFSFVARQKRVRYEELQDIYYYAWDTFYAKSSPKLKMGELFRKVMECEMNDGTFIPGGARGRRRENYNLNREL